MLTRVDAGTPFLPGSRAGRQRTLMALAMARSRRNIEARERFSSTRANIMMNCPRCGSTSLDERERSGVTVDVCPSCRGVWLDRGELEKLLGHAKRELEEERAYYASAQDDREPPSSSRRHEHHRGSSRDHGHPHGRPHYKKRSWLENLGEIFD